MEYACITHGICLYHAWNTPVRRMEYSCIMLGIHLYDAWNTPGTCRFHAWNIHIFHACNMHETCMKIRHQSMHVTCMSHTWKTSQIPACYMHVSGIMHVTCMKFQIIQYCHWKFHAWHFLDFGAWNVRKHAWNVHVSGAPFWVGQ